MRIDIVRQAMRQLPAIPAHWMPAPLALEVHQPQRVHFVGIPDFLHRLLADVADDQLAAPIQKTRTHLAVGIHRKAIKNVRTNLSKTNGLLINSAGYCVPSMFLGIEIRPTRREVFDGDAIAMISERVEKALLLVGGQDIADGFDHDLAFAPVRIEPFYIFYKTVKIEFDACYFQISFRRHAVNRNIYFVEPGIKYRPHALG